MPPVHLHLHPRDQKGKESAKKIRREDKIPGIFYARGRNNIRFVAERKEFSTLLGHSSGLLNVDLNGEETPCIIREIQFDPLTHSPIHLDLMGIVLTEKINVSVPIHLIGTPDGVKTGGGMLQHVLREISIECLPTEIPENIEVDVTALQIGDSVHISDLEVKVKVLDDAEQVIASVAPPRVIEEMVVEEVAEEEGAAEPEVISKREEEESE